MKCLKDYEIKMKRLKDFEKDIEIFKEKLHRDCKTESVSEVIRRMERFYSSIIDSYNILKGQKMTIDTFLEAAEEKGLEKMGLTGASNGYPEPDLGWFICGFDTYEEAKHFAKENGGIVSVAEWRDGWGYAHYLGDAGSAMEIDESWYGNNYRIISSPFKNFAEYLGLDEDAPYEDFEDTEIEMKEKFKELESAINAYVDWESQDCILYENEFFGTIAKDGREMNFSHDTENKAIGVAFLWSGNE